jgi:hypothetical protein
VGGGAAGADGLYDSRLFNQDQGMAAGFGQDDSYNMYDKPLFADRGSNLYRPKAAADDELYGSGANEEGGVRTDKFKVGAGEGGWVGVGGGAGVEEGALPGAARGALLWSRPLCSARGAAAPSRSSGASCTSPGGVPTSRGLAGCAGGQGLPGGRPLVWAQVCACGV